jgi:hypothetical protein
MLQHVQTIHFGAWSKDMKDTGKSKCARFLSSDKLVSLRKVKVTLVWYHSSSLSSYEQTEEMRVRELLETYLPGKEIEVCCETAAEWHKRFL